MSYRRHLLACLVALPACGDNNAGSYDWVVLAGTEPGVVAVRNGGTWATVEGATAGGTTTYSLAVGDDIGVFFTCPQRPLSRELLATPSSLDQLVARLPDHPCGDGTPEVEHHVTGTASKGRVMVGPTDVTSDQDTWGFDLIVPEGDQAMVVQDTTSLAYTILPTVHATDDIDVGEIAIPSTGKVAALTTITVDKLGDRALGAVQAEHFVDPGVAFFDMSTTTGPDTFDALLFDPATAGDIDQFLFVEDHVDVVDDKAQTRELVQHVGSTLPTHVEMPPLLDGVTFAHDSYTISVGAVPELFDIDTFYYGGGPEQEVFATGDYVAFHAGEPIAIDADIAGYGGEFDPDYATTQRYFQADTSDADGSRASWFIIDNTGVPTSASPARRRPAAAASRARPR